MSEKFAIHSKAEAELYLRHKILGSRLRECTNLMLSLPGQISAILGYPDDLKFKSSMTLFDAVSPKDIFEAALVKFFAGVAGEYFSVRWLFVQYDLHLNPTSFYIHQSLSNWSRSEAVGLDQN